MKNLKENMGSIVMALVEAVVGILLFINPVKFTEGIIVILGIVLTVSGVVQIVAYFRANPLEAAKGQGLTKGLLELIMGLFCIFKSGWFTVTFPVLTIIYGVLTLVLGISKIEGTVDLLRLKNKQWKWCAVSAVLTVLCAAIILANPFATTNVLWTFVAISLIVEAVLDILAIFMSGKEKTA